MTHIYIVEDRSSREYEVRYGDLCIHVEGFEQAKSMALQMGVQLGLIGC